MTTAIIAMEQRAADYWMRRFLEASTFVIAALTFVWAFGKL
jgi:hypothetical protein